MTALVNWAQPWGTKKTLYVRHLFFRLCNCWSFDPCVSHVRLWARRTSIYARALAVCWCHEAAYHRKSETGSPWPFVWVNKTSRAHSFGFDRGRHKYSWLCHEKKNKKSTKIITSTGQIVFSCIDHQGQEGGGAARLGSRLFNLSPDGKVSRFNQSNKSERQHGLRSSTLSSDK